MAALHPILANKAYWLADGMPGFRTEVKFVGQQGPLQWGKRYTELYMDQNGWVRGNDLINVTGNSGYPNIGERFQGMIPGDEYYETMWFRVTAL
jgi:hypothetical protein